MSGLMIKKGKTMKMKNNVKIWYKTMRPAGAGLYTRRRIVLRGLIAYRMALEQQNRK